MSIWRKRRKQPIAALRNESRFHEVWRRLCKNKMAVFGLIFLAFIVFIAIFADVLAPYGIDDQDISRMFTPPCKEFPLGTDNFGRDNLSRMMYGARISLSCAVIATTIAMVVGGSLGLIAGFYGGKLDNLIMRIVDIIGAIPNILLCIAIAATLGGGLGSMYIALSVGGIGGFARMTRATVLSERDHEYVEAATASNASSFRILMKYILPNVSAPLIVGITMSLAAGILGASTLSYIGLGAQAPTPEWGALLSVGRTYIRDSSYLVTAPGVIIMLTVFSLYSLGDGLRDALDPRLRGR